MWGRIPVPYREHVLTPSSGQEGVGCPQCCEGSRWMTPAGGRRGQPKTRGCWEGCLRQVRTAGHYGKWRLRQLLPDLVFGTAAVIPRRPQALCAQECLSVVGEWEAHTQGCSLMSDKSESLNLTFHSEDFFFHIQYIKFCFQQGHKKAEKCVTSL